MSPTPDSTLADPQQAIADLQRELAELQQRLDDAQARETATAEVLQVINSSPGDLVPVFDAILEKALALCNANFGQLMRFDGVAFLAHIWRGHQPGPRPSRVTPTPGMALYQIAHGEEIVHVRDITADDVYRSGNAARRRLADEYGGRTAIWVALKRGSVLRGAFVIFRTEVRPFTDNEIALLQGFAAQAVVAMENARLITETREGLEQQTATAEVLQVINSSPGDLAPVFEAMLEKAMRLCEASFGVLSRIEGDHSAAIAGHGIAPELAERMRQPRPIVPGNAHYRLVHGEDVVQVEDITADDLYRSAEPGRRSMADIGGARTVLWVALRKDDVALGAFVAYRREVRPFSEKQIALLQNFAAQAVIAMENARLITETREALDQQTATAEVLGVINASPGHLAPVFDAMLEKATRLCDANLGTLSRIDGENFYAVAVHGAPPDFAEAMRQPHRITPGNAHHRLAQGEDVVQIEDITAGEAYRSGNPARRLLADVAGARTVLWVALRKDRAALGAFVVYRREVRPFTDKQIALLQNFAAQAVIAMENARLITETREALEQQTATAEVLQAINASLGDLAPVFDAMLEKALHLCDAGFGQLVTYDGAAFRAAAWRGYEPGASATTPAPGMALYQLVHGEQFVHIANITDDDAYLAGNEVRRRLADDYGAHGNLGCP